MAAWHACNPEKKPKGKAVRSSLHPTRTTTLSLVMASPQATPTGERVDRGEPLMGRRAHEAHVGKAKRKYNNYFSLRKCGISRCTRWLVVIWQPFGDFCGHYEENTHTTRHTHNTRTPNARCKSTALCALFYSSIDNNKRRVSYISSR